MQGQRFQTRQKESQMKGWRIKEPVEEKGRSRQQQQQQVEEKNIRDVKPTMRQIHRCHGAILSV